MKKLILCFTLLITYGCTPSQIETSPVASSCPDKPTTVLHKKDVEEISLNEQTLTKSGLASLSKSIGYKFAAQSGQDLYYYIPDSSICVWIYAPDNQQIYGKELPLTGNYIIQVSALKDLKTFKLQMSLSILQASPIATPFLPTPSPTPFPRELTSTPTPSPTPFPRKLKLTPTPSLTPFPRKLTLIAKPSPTPYPRKLTLTPTLSPTPSPTTFTPASNLNQDQAIEIVKKWHAAKSRIFAPPFDRSLVNQLTTGKIHSQITAPYGFMNELQNNDSYYTFSNFMIIDVMNLKQLEFQASVTIAIHEDITFYPKTGNNLSNADSYKEIITYYFEQENGVWKISNILKVD